MRRLAITVGVALMAVGCAQTRLSGHFGDTAYYHFRDHYRVRYAPGHSDARRLLPPPWELANFEMDRAGRPHRVRAGLDDRRAYERRRYRAGRGRRHFSIARYDLEYRHRETGDLLYARTVPLRHPWLADSLPVLMQRTVASLVVPGADAPDLLGRPAPELPPRLVVLAEGASTVDGQPAYSVRFSMTRDGETEQITLVGVKAPQRLAHSNYVPAVVIFGLITDPERHTEAEPALVDLVRRVDFR